MLEKRRKRKKRRLLLVLIVSLGAFYYFFYYAKYEGTAKKKLIEKKLTVYDQDSNNRPIAIMIDNNVGSDLHKGLQDAYLSYEAIVEGGLSRIMVIYKDKDIDKIGPVRSSRHYFLDYALESDALYAHFGWSKYAQRDISSLGVNNINGLYDSKPFWRVSDYYAPHNVFTSIDKLYSYSKNNLNYDITSDNYELLKYNANEINLPKKYSEDTRVISTTKVSFSYSGSETRSFTYDSTNKYYLRSMNNKAHVDATTGKQYHYKNIIIEKVSNSTLDSKGRQDLETTGSGDGYYITNGYAVPIKWYKDSRNSKTKYMYNNDEIEVNDGNTFIEIVPINNKVTIVGENA